MSKYIMGIHNGKLIEIHTNCNIKFIEQLITTVGITNGYVAENNMIIADIDELGIVRQTFN